jgi:hypothetical protein
MSWNANLGYYRLGAQMVAWAHRYHATHSLYLGYKYITVALSVAVHFNNMTNPNKPAEHISTGKNTPSKHTLSTTPEKETSNNKEKESIQAPRGPKEKKKNEESTHSARVHTAQNKYMPIIQEAIAKQTAPVTKHDNNTTTQQKEKGTYNTG